MGEGIATQAVDEMSSVADAASAWRAQTFLANHDAIILTDPRGRILDWNPAAERMFGYTREEILGRTSALIFPPENTSILAQTIPESVARDGFWSGEITFLRKHGTSGVADTTVSLLCDTDGHVIGYCCVQQDITQRKQAEQALREREAQLAAELADAELLQRVSSQLIQEGRLDALYAQILDAAIAIMRADMGSMQMLYPEQNALRLLAWKGFDPASAAFWEWVCPQSGSSCGVALATSERVVASDVETCDFMSGTEDLEYCRLSGIRAVQSTPLIARDGRLVGMISTHWRAPHQPTERELRLLDMLARQAADLIERKRLDEKVRQNEERQAFLLRLSDAIRRLVDPARIQAEACRLLGEYLHVDRAYYVEVNEQEGYARVHQDYLRADSPSLAGDFRLEDHGWALPYLRRGETVVVTDAQHEDIVPDADRAAMAAVKISAHISTPIVKAGAVKGALCVTEATPRGWSALEIELVRETAERISDAIERAHAEEALVERLGQLEATFESMVDGVAIYDSEGRIVRLNTALRELLGLDDAYAALPVGERVPRLTLRGPTGHPLSSDQTPPARVARGEIFTGAASMDMLAHTLDGREIELNVSGAPVRDAEGRIVGGVCVYRDVTARHQAELAVRESEEKFRTLADHIPTLAWMAHPDGNIFWYNQRWYDYTGATPESQAGWGWESVHDPEMLPAVLERWTQSLATGDDFEMVFPLRGADGVFRPFLTRVIAVKDERGAIVRWFGTNTDVTEQRAAEEALRAANQVKEEFLSVANHELRTPLTSIMPNVQLAARQLRMALHTLEAADREPGPSQEDLRQLEQRMRRPLQLVENTERQVKRLSRLVDDLLDVSRIQTGKLELRLEPCDLLAIVRETVHEQRAAWPGRRITLDLPRRVSLAIHCDADRIGQGLTNYLTNALKYSPEDQPVAVRVRTQGQMARVETRDHGPGLTDEQRQRLFERFYRVPGVEQQSGSGIGLGLGLYICQSLIERHSGQVGVESAPGEGSTFWFTIPLLTDTETPGD